MKQITLKSKQTGWNVLLVFLMCVAGFFPALMFVVKWITTDFDTTLEYFCTFVDGVFGDE